MYIVSCICFLTRRGITMSNKKKNGRNLTCFVDATIFEALEDFCARERRSKTSTVEIALSKFLEDNGCTISTATDKER